MDDLRAATGKVKELGPDQLSEDDQHLLLKLKNEDFLGVTVTHEDAVCFKEVIPKCSDSSVKAVVIRAVAELAKEEKNRCTLVDSGMVPLLLKEIEDENHDVTLQCFRTIGNICMENDKGQQAVLDSGSIGKILDKFKKMADVSEEELGNLPAMAYGCVNNMSDDNASLQTELVKQGAITIFLNCVKSFIKNKSDMAELVIISLCALAYSDEGREQFIQLNIVKELLSFLKDGDEKTVFAILDSLTELTGEDELADLICAEESLQLMMDAAEALPGFQETKDSDKILKKIVDTLVLYTSNESFRVANSDTTLLKRFLEWLNCINRHIQVSAALAIGNYARSDIECTELVKNGVHNTLIDFLHKLLDQEETAEQQQAILSALKNITIPVVNKPILAETKLPECACRAVSTPVAAVQFKAIAVLRLLVQGQTGLAVGLCENDNLLRSVDECAERDGILGLCSEARRLVAALAKNCNSTSSMNALLNHNAMRSLVALLASDHVIMQNEGLVSIVTLLTCGSDAVDKFIAAEGLERTTKMLSQSSGKPHVVFNLVSLYTAVCQTENGKTRLKDSDFIRDVEELASNPNEMIQTRCTDLLNILRT